MYRKNNDDKMNNILIAGIPRSGTTLIYKAIRINNKGFTAKTHLLPDLDKSMEGIKIDDSFKVIFLFGNPINSIISTYKMCKNKYWMVKHAKHCGYLDNIYPLDIINKDNLNYEKMFDEWMTTNRFKVLPIRYEEIWNNVKEIEKFVGFKINLLEYKERETKTTDVSQEILNKIKVTYRDLIKKIEMIN